MCHVKDLMKIYLTEDQLTLLPKYFIVAWFLTLLRFLGPLQYWTDLANLNIDLSPGWQCWKDFNCKDRLLKMGGHYRQHVLLV